ncbi:hypothetical protein RB195_008569 [Necator americanus]|uniref:Uncharacterized protein n=1 Tax=Necator americanus TaxID=51031 RepID=A0ABR1CQH6_NECAM
MASISSSSENFEPDEELVRDAALCLRSFSGSREVIPYSKFCERFKKTAGYSIKCSHIITQQFPVVRDEIPWHQLDITASQRLLTL